MTANKTISIIVPIYNVQDYIFESLKSLQNQSYKKIEVIMINDCSTDKSPEIAQKFTNDHRFKLYFNSKNMGLSYTRNKGIDLATGDLIYYFDPDDILSPNFFQLLVNEINKTGVQLISFNYQQVEGNEVSKIQSAKINYCHEYSQNAMFAMLLNEKLATAPWAYITYTDLVKGKNVYFPNGRNYEDITYTPRLMANIQRMRLIHFSQGGYYYRWQRKGSITFNSNVNIQKIRKELCDKIYLNEKKYDFLNQLDFIDKDFLNSWYIRELTNVIREKIHYINVPELKLEFLNLREKLYKQIKLPHNYLSKKNRLKEILVTNSLLCQLYRILDILK